MLPPDNEKVVFVKDFAAGLKGNYEYIPSGFRHSFLIRHPYQVFASWDRMLNRAVDDKSKQMKLSELPEMLLPSGFFFKEQYDLYQHVKEYYEPNPVIIDTEDLLSNPGHVLKAYCEKVGLPYSDDLLQWEPGSECMDRQWMVAKEQILGQSLMNVHKETFSNTHFGPPTKVPNREDVSDDVLYCSDKCIQYYEEMYANRLQP